MGFWIFNFKLYFKTYSKPTLVPPSRIPYIPHLYSSFCRYGWLDIIRNALEDCGPLMDGELLPRDSLFVGAIYHQPDCCTNINHTNRIGAIYHKVDCWWKNTTKRMIGAIYHKADRCSDRARYINCLHRPSIQTFFSVQLFILHVLPSR